jgi:hypothetical protein
VSKPEFRTDSSATKTNKKQNLGLGVGLKKQYACLASAMPNKPTKSQKTIKKKSHLVLVILCFNVNTKLNIFLGL